MAQEKENPWTAYLGKQKPAINEMKYTEDSHTVRVLPAKEGSTDNFFGYTVHWVKQSSGATMPIFHDKDDQCELCKAIGFLRRQKAILKNEHGLSDDSPEVKRLDNAIMSGRPSTKFDLNIIDRDDYISSDKSVKIKRWAIGPMLYKPLFEYARDYGSPSHDETGYDLAVKITAKGGGYKEYKLMTAKRNGSDPLSDEEVAALNKAGYDLRTLRKKDFSTEERIKDIIINAQSKILRDAVMRVAKGEDVYASLETPSNEVDIQIDDSDLIEDKKEEKTSTRVARPVDDDDDDADIEDIELDDDDFDDEDEKKN